MTEITDEQRAAVDWLHEVADKTNGQSVRNHVRLLLDALPSELTNPQPALPTASWTAWSDTNGDIWMVDGVGKLYCPSDTAMRAEDYAPFTRLVPEGPQITREQIEDILRDYHAEQETGLVQRLLALVNGADQ